jgi:hypothetical protein
MIMHRDNFGAMNKRTFLQAIEKPFTKAFTVENIKKSFEIVGLHPFNPSVIKTSRDGPQHSNQHSNSFTH